MCGCEHINECIRCRMCIYALSPFAPVFYKCGGVGGVLSRHPVCIYYPETALFCNGMAVYTASRPLLSPLSRRAALKLALGGLLLKTRQ